MYRQGDVLVEPATLPTETLTAREDRVIAEGEATGHAHKVEGDVELYEDKNGTLYCRVVGDKPATLVHDEHAAVTLPPGDYKVTRQVQLDPNEDPIRVAD